MFNKVKSFIQTKVQSVKNCCAEKISKKAHEVLDGMREQQPHTSAHRVQAVSSIPVSILRFHTNIRLITLGLQPNI